MTGLRELGCSTCDSKRIDHKAVKRKLSRDQCFFMQNAQEFARAMPLGAHSPAIVHGLPNELMVCLRASNPPTPSLTPTPA